MEIKVRQYKMEYCIFHKPCDSIPADIDHNRLSHYRPLTGENRVLQDRESRGHFPTQNTLRLLAGSTLWYPSSPGSEESEKTCEGSTYAS